jgi:aromatic-L-amino-acid decarboxylase
MMPLEDFRKNAKTIIDWSVEFFQKLKTLPVKSKTYNGELRLELPLSAPQKAEEFEAIWKDFCEKIIPKVNHWQHPKFFAYFPMTSSYPSILADMATSIINTQAMSWELSPAATELEEIVLSWLQQEMRLPIELRGVIHDTASTSTLCALMAARDRATSWQMLQSGWMEQKKPLILYASSEAHSSIEKTHFMLGLGKDHFRKIPVDKNFSMDIVELEKQITSDVQKGFIPYAIVGCFGTTSTAAVDPLVAIGEIAKKFKIWFHVDGAYSGPTLLLKDFQEKFQSRNWNFDSFVLNPHKWMLTGFDCSILYVKNPVEYQKSFKVEPPYLKLLGSVDDTKEEEAPTEFRHWSPALGRRFRALKLWFVIRSFGVDGIRNFLRSHLKMAQNFSQKIQTLPEVQIMAPVVFGLVCFRYQSAALNSSELNDFNQQWLLHINANGLYLSPTVLQGGVYVIRFSIGSTFCQDSDIEEAFEVIRKTLIKLLATHRKISP